MELRARFDLNNARGEYLQSEFNDLQLFAGKKLT